MPENRKVLAGPAGHWYAMYHSWQFGDTLVGRPMMADDKPDILPPHPNDEGTPWEAGWYDITDPAPECNDTAIIAELRRG